MAQHIHALDNNRWNVERALAEPESSLIFHPERCWRASNDLVDDFVINRLAFFGRFVCKKCGESLNASKKYITAHLIMLKMHEVMKFLLFL